MPETGNAPQETGTGRALLRHAVATVAYRGGKALRGARDGFADFRAGEGARTPGQIVAHIGDLYDWALSLAKGKQEWHSSEPLPWDKGVERFLASLKAFDDFLASDARLEYPVEKLFQGPVADSLTHIGQISMLRRLAGEPVKAENYCSANIVPGRVGSEQSAPKHEYD